MDVNFPRHRKVKNSLLFFIVPVLAIIAISLALNMSVWLSILFGFLTLAFIFYFNVIRHRGKHSKFLDSFGFKIKNSHFYEKEYTIGAVPFSNRFMSCCARIEENELFFGRSRHYRALNLDRIKHIEIIDCLGHEVAKLEVQGSNQEEPLYIPWSPLLANQVEIDNYI